MKNWNARVKNAGAWYHANQRTLLMLLLASCLVYAGYCTMEPVGCMLETSCTCATLRAQYVPLPFFTYYRRAPAVVYNRCEEHYAVAGAEADERTCGAVCDPDYGVVRRIDCDALMAELMGYVLPEKESIEARFALRAKRMRTANMTFGTCIDGVQRVYSSDLIQPDGYFAAAAEAAIATPATVVSWGTLQGALGAAWVLVAIALVWAVTRHFQPKAPAAPAKPTPGAKKKE